MELSIDWDEEPKLTALVDALAREIAEQVRVGPPDYVTMLVSEELERRAVSYGPPL